MKSEAFMTALNEIDETYIQETLDRLETPSKVRPRRRLIRSLLAAAALLALLIPSAWAVYGGYLRAQTPAGGVHLRVVDEENEVHEGFVPEVAMVVTADVSGPVGKLGAMRFGWLPDDAPSPDTPYLGEKRSLLSYLEYLSYGDPYPNWENRSVEQLLKEAGMSEEEARTWYTRYHWEKADGALLDVALYDASELYQRDLLLGMGGGKARILLDETRGRYDVKEIQVDYEAYYREVATRTGHLAAEVEWVKNYLFLYEPEGEYLLFLGGSDADFSFEMLEKIAENIEIRITDLKLDGSESYLSFLLLDLGRG